MKIPKRDVASTEHYSVEVGVGPSISSQRVSQMIASSQPMQFIHPQAKLIHELFEDQVERTPNSTAANYGGLSLTYVELNTRANRLARYLRARGAGPEQLVGLCIERSLEMIVGLLGILKAGGAYIPLDPSYPTERLRYMLEDAVPRMVLTKQSLMAVLPPTPAEVIALDAEWEEIAKSTDKNLSTRELGLDEQNLVYVIYTSGSTGRPKGTAMPHGSMVNLIEWHRKTFPGNRDTRVLQYAALSFDVAFQEIFSTLSTGGSLVLVDEWIRRDPRALIEFLRDHSISRLFLPPLMLQNLADSSTQTGVYPRSLQDVITAGEQLRINSDVAHFFEELGDCRLHNHYGPTEAHVVTTATLSGHPSNWPTLPSIGQPIPNINIYILDGQGCPVSGGSPGEIHIGGAGVARGYLNRPQMTAERFLADPFRAEPMARLYRTGDLGQWQADETLQYLGRNDEQVKIRGYRIELTEIEARLSEHADVREAAVVVREDVIGERRLVGYITQRDQRRLSMDTLRPHLSMRLPDYMIPGAFVLLESLPLTPSGKLDRRSLPPPPPEAYASGQHEPPQGEIEEALAAMWQELLHIDQVGRQHDFFELGGDSLIAMKLMRKIAARFSRRLHFSALLGNPTLRDMARLVGG